MDLNTKTIKVNFHQKTFLLQLNLFLLCDHAFQVSEVNLRVCYDLFL